MSSPSFRTAEEVTAQAASFLLPLGNVWFAYTSSRVAVLKDGSTKPVLTLLAELRFPDWAASPALLRRQAPFWKDGDLTNETLENVDLADRPHGSRCSRKCPCGRRTSK